MSWGWHLPRGVCPGDMSPQGGCLLRWVYPSMHWGRHFPVDRMTDRCKNITFPQLRLRTVNCISTLEVAVLFSVPEMKISATHYVYFKFISLREQCFNNKDLFCSLIHLWLIVIMLFYIAITVSFNSGFSKTSCPQRIRLYLPNDKMRAFSLKIEDHIA